MASRGSAAYQGQESSDSATTSHANVKVSIIVVSGYISDIYNIRCVDMNFGFFLVNDLQTSPFNRKKFFLNVRNFFENRKKKFNFLFGFY